MNVSTQKLVHPLPGENDLDGSTGHRGKLEDGDREVLCTLELPYRLHNVARGSRSREAFAQRSGRMRVPYLIDPNTGSEMFESADIVRYLEQTYAE